jgi:hypothetical protein
MDRCCYKPRTESPQAPHRAAISKSAITPMQPSGSYIENATRFVSSPAVRYRPLIRPASISKEELVGGAEIEHNKRVLTAEPAHGLLLNYTLYPLPLLQPLRA